MKSRRSGRKFLVSRAVEEPLEASIELGEDIQKIAKKALLPMNLGIFAFILIVLFLLPSIFDILLFTWRGFRGDEEFTANLLINALISAAVIIFLFAVIITVFLYLTQIMNFISRNLLKCCKISDLTEAEIAEDKKVEKERRQGKYLKNPIFAVMDLEEESLHVIPQIVKMLRFCVFFIGIILIILILTFGLQFGIDYHLLFSMDIIRVVVGVVIIVMFLIMLKMLMDTESDFRYIHTRHSIIDSVRFQKDISVPTGDNKLSRLTKYLSENDPYIKSAIIAEKKEFSGGVKLKGASGKEHTFDSYISGTNILKAKSVALGMPMGKFGVFIRIFKDDITLTKLKEISDAAMDVCKSENMFPLRIIALQWTVSDIPEDVYDYVLENPIEIKNTLTHLEIVAEDNEVYSFIPLISYGESFD
jgi:hypothetical protein